MRIIVPPRPLLLMLSSPLPYLAAPPTRCQLDQLRGRRCRPFVARWRKFVCVTVPARVYYVLQPGRRRDVRCVWSPRSVNPDSEPDPALESTRIGGRRGVGRGYVGAAWILAAAPGG